jgi:ribosomal protein S18 acetylase RimI-like enzyme
VTPEPDAPWPARPGELNGSERLVALGGEPHPERYVEVALPGVHEAGRPYVDWFFGGFSAARDALRSWMVRPSSEVFVGRAVLLTAADAVLGGLIALDGAELSRCRRDDAVAAIALAGPGERGAVAERIQVSRELFPPVPADEFYLSRIWVVPEARRAGYGTALLRHYIEAGARRGCARLRLDVWSESGTAIGLYRRFGFETLQQSVSGQAGLRYTSMVAEPPGRASDDSSPARK